MFEKNSIGILLTVALGLLSLQFESNGRSKAKIRYSKNPAVYDVHVMEIVGKDRVSGGLKNLIHVNGHGLLCYEGEHPDVCDVLDYAVAQENRYRGLQGPAALHLNSCDLGDGENLTEGSILAKISNATNSNTLILPELPPCK